MKKHHKLKVQAAILAAGVLPATYQAQAAAFGNGNLVVEQVGGVANFGAGAANLTNGGTAIFVDEFLAGNTGTNAAQTAPVQQITIPTANNGSQLGLVESGTATSDGFINRSADGQYLTLGGYNAALGGNTSVVGIANVARVVGRLDNGGNLDTSTSSLTANAGNNIRSTVAVNGTTIYSTGAGSNTVAPTNLFTFGQSTSTGIATTTSTGTAVTNTRASEIFTTAVSAQSLYYSTASGANTTFGIYTYGGLPTGAATSTLLVSTLVVNGTTNTGVSPYGFSISPDGKTVYVADDGSTTAGGGIRKYTSTTGAAGSFTFTGVFGTPSRGLTVDYSNPNLPVLYATTAVASANTLYSITDDGVIADFTGQTADTLATAPANTVFRGVDFTPTAVPEPTTVLGGVLLVGAAGWIKRRRSRGAA